MVRKAKPFRVGKVAAYLLGRVWYLCYYEQGRRRRPRVGVAIQAGGLDLNALVSTLPQPPRRRPGSAHAEVAQRLVFERVQLEALVRFCHALTSANPRLHVSGLRLRAADGTSHWNADVSISCWILARGGRRRVAGEVLRRLP